AQAQTLEGRDPEHPPAGHEGHVEVDDAERTARLLFHVEEDGAAIQPVIEPACRTEVFEAVELAARLREQEVAVRGRIDRLREQDGGARRIDVATVVVEPEGNFNPPGADPEQVPPWEPGE